MKRYLRILIGLIIFILGSSCGIYQLAHFFSPAGSMNVSLSGAQQNCNDLTFYINGRPGVLYVTVDEVEFSCTMRPIIYEGFSCSGPSSSLDPNLTVKIYDGKRDYDPNKVIVIPNKRSWEECDYDGDGVVDSEDDCLTDPGINTSGLCSCSDSDDDIDGDSVPDCVDQCKEDSEKTEPGRCGCGVSDLDTDQDGMPDCLDECPADPAKEAPENCGCGELETDTDGDFTPDCVDLCPEDIGKTEPGICGCGLADLDEDEDGLVLCEDICPGDAWHDEVGDPCNHDEDGDGTTDNADNCPFDPKKTSPGICGCGKTEASCQ